LIQAFCRESSQIQTRLLGMPASAARMWLGSIRAKTRRPRHRWKPLRVMPAPISSMPHRSWRTHAVQGRPPAHRHSAKHLLPHRERCAGGGMEPSAFKCLARPARTRGAGMAIAESTGRIGLSIK
jgi:hypothetical protein